MKTQFKLFALLAVICIFTAAALTAETADKNNFTARAMLVKMDAEQFRRISTGDSGAYQSPGAMEVIERMVNETATTLAAYSQLRFNTDITNGFSENRIVDRVRMPKRKTVTGEDIKPYTLYEYSWVEIRKYFKIKPLKNSLGEKALRCECVFEYESSQVAEAQNKPVVFKNSDEVIESQFSCSATLLLHTGRTSVAGYQKVGEDYYILLLNLQ
jgi:hypothetical protein